MGQKEIQGRKGPSVAFLAPAILALMLWTAWLYKGNGSAESPAAATSPAVASSLSIDIGQGREAQDQGVIGGVEPNIGETIGGNGEARSTGSTSSPQASSGQVRSLQVKKAFQQHKLS